MDDNAPLTPDEIAQYQQIVGQPQAQDNNAPLTAEEAAQYKAITGQDIPVAGDIRNVAKDQLDQSFPEQVAHMAIGALPLAGGVVGGIVGAGAGPAGAVGGAGLGAAAGSAAEQGLNATFFPNLSQPNMKEAAKEIAKQGLIGAAGEGAGQLIGGALSAGLSKAANFLKSSTKANAPEIMAAAERLGIKPTTGMLSDKPTIQGLESSLNQSPSFAGALVQRETSAVEGGLKKAAQNFDTVSSPLTKYESGEAIKTDINKSVGDSINKAQAFYESLENNLKDVPLNDTMKTSAVNSIKELPGVRVSSKSPSASLGKRINEEISGIKTVEDAKFLRTQYGKQLKEAVSNKKFPEAEVLGNAYDKLTQIRNAALESNSSGETLQTLKAADKLYSAFSKQGQKVADSLGIKYSTPQGLLESIDEIPSEKLSEKIFNLNNVNNSSQFQDIFPKAYEKAKEARISQLIEKSKVRGEISPRSLLKTLKGVQPEIRKMLFGNNQEAILKDMQTIVNAIPEKMGPSGTPQGQEFIKYATPGNQYVGALRLLGLKGGNAASGFASYGAKKAAAPLLRSTFGQGGARALLQLKE